MSLFRNGPKKYVQLIEEKYSRTQIEEFAKDWQPWEYLGGQKRISYKELYGVIWGFIVKRQKKIWKRRKG